MSVGEYGSAVGGFLRVVPVVDLVVGLAIVWFTDRMWAESRLSPEEASADERALGATAILGQLNGTITAATILGAAIGTIGALGLSEVKEAGKDHLRLAFLWSLLSLSVAVWALGTVPSMVPKHNVAKSRTTALLAISALYLFLASGVRFGLMLWGLLG